MLHTGQRRLLVGNYCFWNIFGAQMSSAALSVSISFLCWPFPSALLQIFPCLPTEEMKTLYFCYMLTSGRVWQKGFYGQFRNLHPISNGIMLLTLISSPVSVLTLAAVVWGLAFLAKQVAPLLFKGNFWQKRLEGKKAGETFLQSNGRWFVRCRSHSLCISVWKRREDQSFLVIYSCRLAFQSFSIVIYCC